MNVSVDIVTVDGSTRHNLVHFKNPKNGLRPRAQILNKIIFL